MLFTTSCLELRQYFILTGLYERLSGPQVLMAKKWQQEDHMPLFAFVMGITEAVKTGWELKMILFKFWGVWVYKGLWFISKTVARHLHEGDKGAGKGWRRVV